MAIIEGGAGREGFLEEVEQGYLGPKGGGAGLRGGDLCEEKQEGALGCYQAMLGSGQAPVQDSLKKSSRSDQNDTRNT